MAADPEALARMLADWVAREYPERVRSAYWVNVSGDRDIGFEVTIAQRKVPWFRSIRGSALIGRQTWGAGIFTDVAHFEQGDRSVVASLGIGATKPYIGGDWSAVVSLSLKF